MKPKEKILITGISRGIGKAIASDLKEKGYDIYGTSRHPELLLDKIEGVEYIKMDLSDEDSIAACFKILEKVDILINNAGQSQMGPAEEIQKTKIRNIFEVNFFGTISLTKKYLCSMRENKKGLIINIGSLSGKFSVPFQSSYASSKIALNTWTQCLRKEIRHTGVHVTIVEPYFINSGIKLEYLCIDGSVYKNILERVYEKRKKNLKNAYNPQVVVETINKILRSKKPDALYISGRKGNIYAFINRFLSSAQAEKIICKASGL